MIRDSKFSRQKSGKNLNFEEIENVPPSNTIDQELGFKSSKVFKTPTKLLKTREKQGVLARNRYGWGQDSTGNVNVNMNTPRRGSSGFSEPSSTHSTPTKSVGKPHNSGVVYGGSSRPPVNGGARTMGNFTALFKGVTVTSNGYPVNTIEVPHFELREDPSFWMDHNVQVLIRVRPLNGMEITSQGYNRCLKQESAQCLTWVGHPETRFTFDHIACETIDQETLFKMVGLPMVENCLSGYNSCMFAYGQTGSGKTHTMLGEINDLEVKPSPYRGMTPRIFEFLFARIIAEEESRKNERLMYNCKCSFLEIYNEHITDLLDPSSTNLQLREDVKNGVYVENLTEFEVHTVSDILKLLSQGAANRRVASTNMNRESSRSHSVFTCVIESRWEKDSTSNLRFARLNLVDLAGSERQKSSGAEGERLKEAANINKSLSTLGHVIMVLVDGANARTRHVPYRDSKLTFLLQDSLGGNSKTMIIANVSPSISSAMETLNTLKFAQRAKLIQNNAVINEDASGDVVALQHQIRLLKEELAILKRYNIPRSLTFNSKDENSSNASSIEMNLLKDDENILRVSCKQLKSLETSLNGALRREKSTENCIKQLEAEIEQLNCLVRQREEENRCTKMMLKFREDKIQRMESVLARSIPMDSYLLEENNMLNEEIRIISSKVNRNPEVTRFAVENIRLLEQIRRFQDFYEEGEREMLLTEVSELRDQLVIFLDENLKNDNHMNPSAKKEAAEDKNENVSLQTELKKSQEELEKCRDNLNSCLEKNAKLCREISDLNALLEMQKSVVNDQIDGIEVIKEPIFESSSIGNKKNEEIIVKDMEKVVDLQLEVEILNIMLKEERSIHVETEENFSLITKQYEDVKEELREAKSIIEALEIQQIVSINELEEKEVKTISLNSLENEDSFLQAKLKKVQDSLEKAKKLNMLYQTDRACKLSNEEEMDQVRKQVEAETTEVIVCLQEEIGSFQLQMQESILKEKETQKELTLLREKCEEKDRHLNSLYEEFDLLTTKIEEVLTVGHKALDDASNLFGSGKRTLVSEQLQIIARRISEKELKIEELNSCLEEAKTRGNEMESMLRSLRGATLVMSEAHQQDCNKKDEEIDYLLLELSEKSSIITLLEEQTRLYEVELMNAKVNTTQQSVEACCYLNKFVDTRDNIKEADSMINKLVTENEAMKRKEVVFVNEKDMLEGKLVMDMYAKEIELFIMLSKLEQVVLENNDLEKEKTSMSMVHDKFKEEIIISYVDLQLNDWISKEKDVEAKKVIESLDMEILEFKTVLDEKNTLIESLQGDLKTVTCKKYDLDIELLRVRKDVEIAQAVGNENELYEVELMDAKRNATQNAVEYCCYLDKFIETQHNLVTENEAMKIEIAELKRKEVDISHQKQQVINEKDEELRCLEEKIMTDLFAKETELSIMSSKLEKLALQNNDFEKFKEDMIISYVDTQLKNCIFSEIDSELKMAQGLAKVEELYEVEHIDAKLNTTHQAVESFCYLEKFKEADFMMNKLVTENEAMKIEIAEMKRKEGIFVNERDMLKDNYSVLMKERDISHQKQQMVNDKDEELRCMEEKLLTVLFAKEMELFIVLSKLKQVASENICMSTVFKKFKEEMIISNVEVEMAHALIKENEANATKAKELYELEFMDAKLNAQHQEVESFCYLDKFKEAAFMINKLVTENEAMKTDIAEMKRKEGVFINEWDMFKDSYSVLMKEKQEEINEKDEELRCLKEKLVTDLYAKDMELFIVLSKLEQVASENNDFEENICMSRTLEKFKEETIISYVDMQFKDAVLLEKDVEVGLLQKEELRRLEQNLLTDLSAKDIELSIMSSKLEQMASENNDLVKEKIMMSTVIEKFKENVIISYVDMQFKDWILVETNADVGFLQKEVKMHEEALKNSSSCCSALVTSSCKLEHELEIMSAESRLRKEENERLVVIIKNQRDEIEEFEYELYENVVKGKVFEAQLVENVALISRERESIESLLSEIHMLKKIVEDALKAKDLTNEQLAKTKKTMESMEMEIFEFKTAFNENNTLIESLKKDLQRVVCKRDELFGELLRANKEVEMAKALGDENGAIATKAKQAREIIKLYAEEKEKELKLYEKSVEELEYTVHVLENQVDLMKGDAEKQRLQREELELEVRKIRQREELLTTENETFKVKMTELENEVKKLSGEQNLEQRIQHLAKIKEENNALKAQNDEISDKLRRAEAIVTRVTVELTKLRSANGRNSC